MALMLTKTATHILWALSSSVSLGVAGQQLQPVPDTVVIEEPRKNPPDPPKPGKEHPLGGAHENGDENAIQRAFDLIEQGDTCRIEQRDLHCATMNYMAAYKIFPNDMKTANYGRNVIRSASKTCESSYNPNARDSKTRSRSRTLLSDCVSILDRHIESMNALSLVTDPDLILARDRLVVHLDHSVSDAKGRLPAPLPTVDMFPQPTESLSSDELRRKRNRGVLLLTGGAMGILTGVSSLMYGSFAMYCRKYKDLEEREKCRDEFEEIDPDITGLAGVLTRRSLGGLIMGSALAIGSATSIIAGSIMIHRARTHPNFRRRRLQKRANTPTRKYVRMTVGIRPVGF